MTLEFSVDNATFRSLVDEALRRIPTASRGQWTLHAPVDPGITFVELFAWLLEQRSFWADQVTPTLVRAVMARFGEQMKTARPAGVALTFEPDTHAEVPRRTRLRIPDTEITFALHHSVLALALARYPTPPASPVIRFAGDIESSAEEDLRSGRRFEILSSSGGPATLELGFVLASAPPPAASAPVSIAFELDSSVAPEWSPDARTVQPPATLTWEYRTTNGQWKPLPNLRDGTGGFRRSGTLRFALPADWSAMQLDSHHEYIGWLRVSTAKATFSSAPVVLAIRPNSALAYHYYWRVHEEAPSWLPLPARTVQLDGKPLPLADRTLVLVSESNAWRRWRVVPDFSTAGPDDRVVVVDRAHARVTFGDGLTGKLPRPTPGVSPQVRVIYEAGAGESGNVPPCAWEALDPPIASALSYVPAVGGTEDETIDDARTRASAALRKPTRAVNPDDHEKVAQATPGVAVARAYAAVGLDLGECGIVPGVTTVFVVPLIHSRTRDDVRAGTAIVAPACDPGLLHEVRMQFARTRLLGEIIHVASAAYRHVRLRVTIIGAPHDRAAVRARIGASLRLFLDPLLGGPDGGGWPFGEAIRPTALLGVAQRELGDRGVVESVEIAIDDKPFEVCEDVEIRAYELVAVDAIDVVIETRSSTEAGLR